MIKPLSKNILPTLNANLVAVPAAHLFQLPEKILQFGTGVLLRGLINQYIHAANLAGDYHGRVVVIKSTETPGADSFTQQDGLYTDYMRGIDNGVRTERFTINASISRVLNASTEWSQILTVAANPQLEIIVSNTTEAGLVYDPTDILELGKAPKTFPSKLLACLYHRWQTLGANASGLVVLPTELVTQNGEVLKKMVHDLAKSHDLSSDFISWLITANDFCNTLVDRIVPGKLPENELATITKTLGYEDALLLVREPFGLWAIETDRFATVQKLGFANTNGNHVIVQKDITTFRELKLRLLNGTHSFTCAVALLLGCSTVKQAMEHQVCFTFLNQLMRDDIAPCLLNNDIDSSLVSTFIEDVQDRFRNPFIEHQWVSISMNYTEKMRMRNLPLIKWAVEQQGFVPDNMAFGFAAFLWLNMISEQNNKMEQVSKCLEHFFVLKDFYAPMLSLRDSENIPSYLDRVLADEKIWQENLLLVKGFRQQLQRILIEINEIGVSAVLNKQMTKALY